MMRSPVVFLLLCVAGAHAMAAARGWQVMPGSPDPNAGFHRRLPLPFEDDITADENVAHIVLNSAEKHQRLVWGLSVAGEQRYVALMRNKSGVYYPHLTPIEVLGINARTDRERNDYAAREAKNAFRRTAKILAFTAAYNRAAMQLKQQMKLPVVQPFDTRPFSPFRQKPFDFKPGDRLFFFVHFASAVKPVMGVLLNTLAQLKPMQLNIYFLDKAVTQAKVSAWAKAEAIDPALVSAGRITLNRNRTQFAALGIKSTSPVLVLERGDTRRIVSLEGF